MLVNNAGTASIAPLLNADVEKMTEMIDLNITALTRLTYAVAPLSSSVARARSSTSPRWWVISPETLNGVYGASKAYVLALSHSLQHELAERASASRQCCQARPRPSSGQKPAFHTRTCPHRSSCRRKTWSMRRSSGSTVANW